MAVPLSHDLPLKFYMDLELKRRPAKNLMFGLVFRYVMYYVALMLKSFCLYY